MVEGYGLLLVGRLDNLRTVVKSKLNSSGPYSCY